MKRANSLFGRTYGFAMLNLFFFFPSGCSGNDPATLNCDDPNVACDPLRKADFFLDNQSELDLTAEIRPQLENAETTVGMGSRGWLGAYTQIGGPPPVDVLTSVELFADGFEGMRALVYTQSPIDSALWESGANGGEFVSYTLRVTDKDLEPKDEDATTQARGRKKPVAAVWIEYEGRSQSF